MLPTQVLSQSCSVAEEGVTDRGNCCAGTHAETYSIPADWQNIFGSTGYKCVACEKGKFVPYVRAGQGKGIVGETDKWYGCWQCPSGTYQDETGGTKCKVCPAGYKDYNNKRCDKCDTDPGSTAWSAYVGSGDCLRKSSGWSNGLPTEETCPKGHMPVNNMCIGCFPGQYGPFESKGRLEWKNALPGGEWGPGMLEEAQQYWHSYNGGEEKYEIAANSGIRGCFLCPRGYAQLQAAQANCIECEAGKYADETMSFVCKDCPEGKISGPGSSDCITCEAGKYGSDGICLDCPEGKYNDESGIPDSCKDCQSGKISGPGSTTCITCEAGKYGSDGICLDCPEGKYNNEASQASCKECPAGYSSIGFSDWERKYYGITPVTSCHSFCSCDNGIGKIDCADPSDKCLACYQGYSLVGDQCVQNQCTCPNGLAPWWNDCPLPNVEHCVGCHIGSVPHPVNKTDPTDPNKNITLTECHQVDHTCTCANGYSHEYTCRETGSLRCCPAEEVETCQSCDPGYFLSDQKLDEQYKFAKEGECASGKEFKIEGIGKNDTQACANACYNEKMDGVPVLGFVIAPDHENTCWCETAVSTCTVNNVNTYVRYDFIDTSVAIISECVSCPENTVQTSDMFSGNQCGCASGSKPRLEDLERGNLREVLNEVCARGEICYSISGDIYTTGETYPLFTRRSPYRPTFGDMLWFYFRSGDFMRVVATDFSGNVIKTFSQEYRYNIAQITEADFNNPDHVQQNRWCVSGNDICIDYIDLNHCSSSCAAGTHKEYSVVGGKLQAECVPNVCTCNTGAPATGEDCPVHGSTICENNCNTDQIQEFTWVNAPSILYNDWMSYRVCPNHQICSLYEGRFYYHDGKTLVMSDLHSPFRIGLALYFYYESTEGLYVYRTDARGSGSEYYPGAFISKDKFTDGVPSIAELTYDMYWDAMGSPSHDGGNGIKNCAFEKKYCVVDLRVKQGTYSCRGNVCECYGGEPAQGENCTNDGQYHCTGCDDPNEEPSKVSWQDDNGLDIITCRPKCNATSHRDEFGYDCEVNVCQCSNGNVTSAPCDEHGKEVCESCAAGYHLVDGACVDCVADKDGNVCTDNRVLYGGECLRLFRDASPEELVDAFQNKCEPKVNADTCETGYSHLGNDCVRDKCFKEDGLFKCGVGKVSVDGSCLPVLDKMSADDIKQKYREQGSCN